MGLFGKKKGMFEDLRNLTAAIDPDELKRMTGSNVPAKAMPDQPNFVAIDRNAALAEASK